MESIFRHRDAAYATQFFIMSRINDEDTRNYHAYIQDLLRRHEKVFGKIPPGRPPDRGFENTIELEGGSKPMITTPYMHPN
jgi:hypothetical protein